MSSQETCVCRMQLFNQYLLDRVCQGLCLDERMCGSQFREHYPPHLNVQAGEPYRALVAVGPEVEGKRSEIRERYSQVASEVLFLLPLWMGNYVHQIRRLSGLQSPTCKKMWTLDTKSCHIIFAPRLQPLESRKYASKLNVAFWTSRISLRLAVQRTKAFSLTLRLSKSEKFSVFR